MSIRDERNAARKAVAEGRFIRQVLDQEGKELDDDIGKRVAGFNSEFWKNRNFEVNETTLTYTHLKQHRFLDMKKRESSRGKLPKRFYNVHDRPIYGHAYEIVKELTVGYTDAVRTEMDLLDGQQN